MSSSRPCLGAWQIDAQQPASDGLLLFLWGLAYCAGIYAILCTGLMLTIRLLAVVVVSALFRRAWQRRLRVRRLRMTPAVLQLELAKGRACTVLPPWSAVVTPWFVLLDVPTGESRSGQLLLVRPRMTPEQWRVFCTLLKLKRRQRR